MVICLLVKNTLTFLWSPFNNSGIWRGREKISTFKSPCYSNSIFVLCQAAQLESSECPVWFWVKAGQKRNSHEIWKQKWSSPQLLFEQKLLWLERVIEVTEMLLGSILSLLSSTMLPASLSLVTNGSPRFTTKSLAANPQRWLLYIRIAPQSPPWHSRSPSPWVAGHSWLLILCSSNFCLDLYLPPHHGVLIPVLNPLTHNSQWFYFPWLILDWYTHLKDHNCEKVKHVFFFF